MKMTQHDESHDRPLTFELSSVNDKERGSLDKTQNESLVEGMSP